MNEESHNENGMLHYNKLILEYIYSFCFSDDVGFWDF